MTTEELWDRIRGEFSRIDDRLTTEIGALRSEFRSEISAVRFDFAHALRTEVGSVRAELREFRGEFESFRDDALTHFDRIYGRLDAQASEHQALRAAVERLERRGQGPSN